MKMALLIILWGIWCALHSVFASNSFRRYLSRHHGAMASYHRLLYNIFAVASLLPVLLVSRAFQQAPVFTWQGWLRPVQIFMIGVACWLFVAGGRRFDMMQFLGFRQAAGENDCAVLTDDCRLDTSGILGWIRHPWYAGGMIVVWMRSMDEAAIVVNGLICGYFVIGAYLEERKLVAEYGNAYRDYRRTVSMFFPAKRLLGYFSGRSDA